MPDYSQGDMIILKKFGTTIKAKRDALRISQEELAERAGLHRTYVGGIEQGRRNLSLLNIMRIAKALEIEPKELLSPMSECEK